MTTPVTQTNNHINIFDLILNRGRFATATVVGDADPVFEEFPTEWEMLCHAKRIACTVLFSEQARKDVRLVCAAGNKTWTWEPSNHNQLVGVGDTRGWTMFNAA